MNPTEFEDSIKIPSPQEFEGPNGLLVTELTNWDSQELFNFVKANGGEKFSPELEQIHTEYEALKMIQNREFSTYGARLGKEEPLAAIITVGQEAEDRVSIGYVVGKDFRGQGVATGAIKTISQNYLMIPGINTIRCYVNPKNIASRGLLEKCGFHLQGEILYKNVFYDLDKPKNT